MSREADKLIASRIHFGGWLPPVATAISFFIMIVAVAVSSGFRVEIRNGISKLTGDIVLTTADFNPLDENSPICSEPSYLDMIRNLDGVESIVPTVCRAGIIRGDKDIQGVIVKGVPSSDSTLQASIPSSLAKSLQLKEGDKMSCCFIGEKVKMRRFTVKEVYDGILDSSEDLTVLVPIQDMQRLNGWDSTQVSALEIRLDERQRTTSRMRQLNREIGSIAYMYAEEDEEILIATASCDKYANLFDWLGLIDFNVAAILILMTIVAGFNMISGLLILLFRNISTIGLLKTIGMRDRSIASVFMRVASRMILTGKVAGNVFALAFSFIQEQTHILRLNPENYFVNFVPVRLNIPAILATDLAVYLAMMMMMFLPSLFISKVDPAKTVKAE